MRYVLLLFFVFLAGLGFSQRIQIEGVEVNYSSDYPDGPLYVIRRTQAEAAPEGQVSFVPGGDRWEFGWTYEGSPQAVAPYEDLPAWPSLCWGTDSILLLPERTG